MSRLAICLFCGARTGNDPAFVELATEVGRGIAERGWILVYGGGGVGLMGAAADAALAAGGEVIGIIPDLLMRREVGHTRLSRLEIVDDMAIRKTRMIELADGFLTLPGGFGTLDELFEVLTLRQLGQIDQPIVLADPTGYWAPMLEACASMSRAGLIAEQDLRMIEVCRSAEAALDRFGPPD